MSTLSDPEKERAEKAVILYLMHNKEGLYARLEPLLRQRLDLLDKESPFAQEIEAQFENLVRREIADEIATNMHVDAEMTYDITRTMDVKAFLAEIKK